MVIFYTQHMSILLKKIQMTLNNLAVNYMYKFSLVFKIDI